VERRNQGQNPSPVMVTRQLAHGVGVCLLLLAVSVHGAPPQQPKAAKSRPTTPLPASKPLPASASTSRHQALSRLQPAPANAATVSGQENRRQKSSSKPLGRPMRQSRTPECREHVRSGTIRVSLYKTLLAQGSPLQMVADLIDIFTWDIDLQTGVHAKDTVRLLVEDRPLRGKCIYHRILAAEVQTKQRRFQAVYYHPPKEEEGAYYRPDGSALRRMFLSAPVRYTRISSAFSYSRLHPVLHTYRPHLGIDYAAPTGTPVRSVGDGVVTWAGMKGGGGNTVEIRHNATYSTYYLHLSRIAPDIGAGKAVEQGQIIGYVGATGLATGPHLDFRISKNGNFLNPLEHQDIEAPSLPRAVLPAFYTYTKQVFARLDRSGAAAK
jgi:murein DD-endopeptidase MepM/ murein hydrolase activator NlpD